MGAVILPWPDGVELIIVQPNQPFPAFRLLPYPITECLPYGLLLLLGDNGLLFVQHPDLIAVCVNGVVKDAYIPEVQRFFDDLIRADAFCAIGEVGGGVVVVLAFAGDVPDGRMGGKQHLDLVLAIGRGIEQLIHELPHHLWRYPCGTKAHFYIARLQVRWLCGGERLHVHSIRAVRVGGLRGLCKRQLFPHVARKVFVGGHIRFILGVRAADVQKDDAAKLCCKLLLAHARKFGHESEIHPRPLSNGNCQCFFRCVHMGNGLLRADGTLGEHIGLGLKSAVFVQFLKGAKQRVSGIVRKRHAVSPAGNAPVLGDIAVI